MLSDERVSVAFLEMLLDSVAASLMVVDSSGTVLFANRSATNELGVTHGDARNIRAGDLFQCAHTADHEMGCGFGEFCRTQCSLRAMAVAAIRGKSSHQRTYKMTTRSVNDEVRTSTLLLTAVPIEYDERAVALLTVQDVTELESLRGLIPICSGCKKIRNDEDFWENVESYIAAHSSATFTHGFCPDCIQRLYGDVMTRKRVAG